MPSYKTPSVTHWNNATIYLLLHDKLLWQVLATAVTLQLSFETFTFQIAASLLQGRTVTFCQILVRQLLYISWLHEVKHV